jgi:hypothetical protein
MVVRYDPKGLRKIEIRRASNSSYMNEEVDSFFFVYFSWLPGFEKS